MNPTEAQLDQIQRWMLASITASDSASRDVDAILLPSRQQSAAERLAVYSHAYFARLLEVLRELLPCTRFAVGEELFDRFAVDYLQAHPPHSYTLARLADKFAEYLDATRPADWGEFVVELVRLELAIDRIFDAPGPEALPPLTIPPGGAGGMRLTFVPGFELHAFGYPVSDYFTRWKRAEEPPWPEPRQQFVALFRRDFIVRRHELSNVQFQLLRAIGCDLRLEAALQEVAEANAGVGDLVNDVRRWFERWARERFFARASY